MNDKSPLLYQRFGFGDQFPKGFHGPDSDSSMPAFLR
jgi:hypothetical protein